MTIDADLEEFAETFTGADFANPDSRLKLESVILSVAQKVAIEEWKGPVTETLKLLKIGIEKLIKSKSSLKELLEIPETGKSNDHPETAFFIQFGARIFCCLALSNTIQRRVVVDILKSLLSSDGQLLDESSGKSYHQQLLLEISWILKESTHKIWQEQTLNLKLGIVEPEKLIIIAKEDKSAYFPSWIIDLWMILLDLLTDNSLILSTIALETSFFEDLLMSAINLLKIDIASDFNLIKSQRHWLKFLHFIYDYASEATCILIGNLLITWVSKCIPKVYNTTWMKFYDDIIEALSLLIEKNTFTISKLSEITQTCLYLSQDFFSDTNIFLKIVQILAIKGLLDDTDLKCFLHLCQIASSHSSNSLLISPFSALLSSAVTISSFKSFDCLKQYFNYIEEIVMDAKSLEIQYHLKILQSMNGKSRCILSKYASECLSNIEKALSSKDLILEQEILLTLNMFLPCMTDLFPDSMTAFNRRFAMYSVLLLSPSYLALVHNYFPDEFVNINLKFLQQSSNSFKHSINSVMDGIHVIQKYTQLPFKKEILKIESFLIFIKSLTQHALFWKSINWFFGWDLQFVLTNLLIETRVTSKELFDSISSAIRGWGCFLSGSQACVSMINQCHLDSSDLVKIPDSETNQNHVLIIVQYLEQLWTNEWNDTNSRENLIIGMIQLCQHSSFNLTFSDPFLKLLLKLHTHDSKRIRNLCRFLYPLLLLQCQSLDIWNFAKKMLLLSLESNESWRKESCLLIIKHLMIFFSLEENQIFEDCFLILFDLLATNDSILRSFVLEQLLSCPDRIFEPLLEKAIEKALEIPDKSLRSLKDLSLLMDMQFNIFLDFSFPYLLPRLILSQNDQILHALICRGKEVNQTKVAKKLILFSGDIIASLILNSTSYDDIFQHYLSLVQPYSPDSVLSIESVFRSNALMLVYNLVIELGGEFKSKAETAIRSVAKELAGSSMSNSAGYLTFFLIQHSLGIISRLQDVLHDVGIIKSRALKIKIAKAMKVYIGLLGDHVSRIASQVLGLLQLLLELPYLWTPTLDAWFCFVKALPSKSLDEFFRQIAAHLLGLEKKMTRDQRQKVVSIFEFLVFEKDSLLQHHFIHMPDFPDDSLWSKIAKAVSKSKNSEKTFVSTLNDILESLSQDNASLISQVLSKLKHLLEENQTELKILLLGEEIDSSIKYLVQKLIKLVNKYHVDDRRISSLAGDCLGTLGAIDPSRMKIAFDSEATLDVSLSLNDPGDILNFSCLLIEKHLVVAFKTTQGPKIQACISYTIQELLRYCGFTIEIVREATQVQTQLKTKSRSISKVDLKRSLIEKWRSFPVSILSTLEPLLSSKYYVEPVRVQKTSYPIFEPKLTYSQWIRRLFLDLMRHAPTITSLKIFELCSCIIDHGDIATAQLLLPYLITNILEAETYSHEDLVKEFCHILLIDCDKESAHLREQHGLCLQMIFRLVDHISKRASICRLRYGKIKSRSTNQNPAALAMYEKEFKSLERFLSHIPQSMIASAAIRSHAYARSLMHYENHFREERKIKSNSELQPLYIGLQKIYAELEDADALCGISNYIVNQSIENQILEHEVAGRWSSAQSCYEVLHQSEPTPHHQNGILKCLQNMGHYGLINSVFNSVLESILMYGEGLQILQKESNFKLDSECRNYLIGASWRMSNWSRVENLLQNGNHETFDATIGRLLIHLASKNYSQFKELLLDAKSRLINPLAAAGMESYQRSFESIMQLAQLTDIETAYKWFLDDSKGENDVSLDKKLFKLTKIWSNRLRTTNPSYRESFLTLHRVLVGILPFDKFHKTTIDSQISKLWIQTAKETRKLGHFQTSFSAILQCVKYRAEDIETQQAKLLWKQGFQHQAMHHLKLFVERNIGKSSSDESLKKARLLLCSWKEITGEVISSALTLEYNQLTRDFPDWEKAHFYLGRYYYRIYEYERKHSADSLKITAQSAHTIIMICREYMKCLSIGSKYLYQAMPKFLSLWLDLTASASNKINILMSDFSKISDKSDSITSAISRFIPRIPTFQFLTAIPQILSRITHPNKKVQDCLDTIIIGVLSAYPQQTLWHLMAVAKSAVHARVQRISTIFLKAKSAIKNPGMMAKIDHAGQLTDAFLHLCNFPVSKEKTKLSMRQDFTSLVNLIADSKVATIIPLQSSLIPSLPTNQAKDGHRPFAHDIPYMTGFVDQVDIMASLQRPRRFGILGSDGKTYNFLAKPDDDLRKDSRLMEFNGIVNRLFKKENESRKRNLHIRTYAVIPLNEKCGLIEWIPHLQGFRAIVMKAYKDRNIYYPVGEVKQIMDVKGVQAKVNAYLDLVSKYPPIFYTWFLESFPEPAKWLSSRSSYTSTMAAMSMVGHVVGLGDRHGENILFDELTGECMHVDLNCLFEKGKTFEIPERVPFRLTHNLVDAFGITGVDGAFKNACEISMGVLRNNRELLKSVLEAFLHDPCLNERGSSSITASQMLARISDKLEGLMEGSSISVNVQGQVEALISEARKKENLAQMYIGWAPYL